MLPPGHVAGGFLATYGLLKVVRPDLDPSQVNQLLVLGAFFGFAPDLDSFVTFARDKAFTIKDPEKNNHRGYASHAPLVWLAIGMVVYLASSGVFGKLAGLTIWLASWSHFILDTVEYGIMWFWPFSRRKFCLKSVKLVKINKSGFFSFWWEFVKIYSKEISFYLEILVILIALIVYLKF